MAKNVRLGTSASVAQRRPSIAQAEPRGPEPSGETTASLLEQFPLVARQARLAPHTLSPSAILALQRTIGNHAVSRLLHPPAVESGQPSSSGDLPDIRATSAEGTPEESRSRPDASPVQVQRVLMTAAALKGAAGGTSWDLGKSTYDHILDKLGRYPKLTSVDQKVTLLTGLRTNITDWLAKNGTRQQKRDDAKRRVLPGLGLEVDYELQVVNPAAPAMDPAMQAAFAGTDLTVQYVKAHIGLYDQIAAHYDRVFPTRTLRQVFVTFFEGQLRRGLINLDKYHALANEFPSRIPKRALAEAYRKVAGHDITVGDLEVPQGNQAITERDIARIKAIWTEVMTDVKYDSLSIPLQFIAKVKADRTGTPDKPLATIYNEYAAALTGPGANPGKADCVGMAKEVQRRLLDRLGIDSHVVGSTGANYLNKLPGARNEAITTASPGFGEAARYAVYSHASLIVPYVLNTGIPQFLHLETANGPDPDNFKRFVSLSERLAMDKDALGGPQSFKSDISTAAPVDSPEDLAKKHIRCKWRMYLTDDAATSGGRAYIDLIEGSVWLGGNGKADMEVAKTFKGTKFDFEAALKKPADVVVLSVKGVDTPKSNAEAVAIFFQMIKEQFKLPDSFVENMLYLASHMDEFGQEILFEPIAQLREVVQLKREALAKEKAAETVSTIAPLPANFDPAKFARAKVLVGEAHESALRRDPAEAARKYREAIATFSTLIVRQDVGINLVGIVTANSADPAALETAIMAYIRAQGARAADIENDYHKLVPPLGLPVPGELGAIVSSFFGKYFTAQGNGKAAFQALMRDYPTFQYRIKPAYRLLFGNSQLQAMLRETLTDELTAEVPDPTAVDNQAAKRLFKSHAPYTTGPAGFKSSTGVGNGFDAEFDPSTGVLKIILKVAYEFKDRTPDPGLPGVAAPGGVGADSYGRDSWTDPAKADWKREYVAKVLGLWNASPAVIKCIRPGWDDVVATTNIEVREMPIGQQRYVISVDKARLVDDRGATKLKSGGVSGLGTDKLLLQEWDVADKIKDPFVHQYLHQTERTTNIEPAFRQDRTRLINTTKLVGRIDFQPGAALPVDAARIRILSEDLQRLGVPSSLVHLHPIRIEGAVASGAPDPLKLTRANYLKAQLTTAGVRNPVSVGESAETVDGAIVQAAPEDPTLLDTYETNWSRLTAAHEFGHMLGLMDEYYQAASDSTVKKLVSAGLLPPDTPGDHFTRSPNANVQKEAEKQAATLRMLEANNIDSPALTNQSGTANMPKTTNIMTGGFEVAATNYVTFWEVLTNMTAGEIDPKYWKIASGKGASF
jgi:hypothetical protein